MEQRSFLLLSCCLVLLLCVGLGSAQTTGKIVYLTDAVSDGAMCIDGTPGAYYYYPGSGDGANKWFIFHMGGGWCYTPQDCYARSKSNLGSSSLAYWPETVDMSQWGGYMVLDQQTNPQFYNWNYVLYVYCDGGSYGGDNDTVSYYQGNALYYRGKRIITAALDNMLNNQGMSQATDVVVSGCSAGGLAVYMHLDWYRDNIPSQIKVRGLPDSGFFLDYNSYPQGYHTQMIWVYYNMNVTSNNDCSSFYENSEPWKCIFAQYLSPHIKTPFFPLQSQYDSWQIGFDLNNTATDMIIQYGKNMSTLFINDVLVNKENGGFMDSCVHHCGEWGDITTQSYTQPTAFQAWYEDTIPSDSFFFQNTTYPCDSCCVSGNEQERVFNAFM